MASESWNHALQDVPDDIIKIALERCPEKFQWVPDIHEFKNLCRMIYREKNFDKKTEEFIAARKQPSINNFSMQRIIDEGAAICKRFKSIFPDKSWIKISGVFTMAKEKARIYHHHLDELNLLLEIQKYTDQDLLELVS